MPDSSYKRKERLGPGEIAWRIVQEFSQQTTTKYCPGCDQHVRALRPGTSRLRQLGLTVVTLGLWGLAWIWDAVKRPGWRCSNCDRRVG